MGINELRSILSKEELIRLYVVEKKSAQQLSYIYKVSSPTMLLLLDKYNIKKRSKKEAQQNYLKTDGSRSKKQSEFMKHNNPMDNIKSREKLAITGSKHRHTMETKIKLSMLKTGVSEFNGFVTSDNIKFRKSHNYKEWRKKVFKRDNYTCKGEHCPYCNNKKGGNLHAHHIKEFAKFPELRLNPDNGITYCQDYHVRGIHKNGIKKNGAIGTETNQSYPR